MNELAVVKAQVAPVVEFSVAQEKLLRDTVAHGCDQNEFLLFLEMAKMKRLDPFGGQIRPVKRWDSTLGRDKMTVQVGIDGFRVIAARTGEHAGTEDAVYDSEEAEHPRWARVTVYRYGRGNDKIPYTATARWSEYVQKKKDGAPNSMWTKMPYLMLGKVAEALALRKAFPDELSGIYTNEEMAQADNTQPDPPARQPVEMPKATQVTDKVLVSGVITARAMGKDNALWVMLADKRVAIPADKVGSHPYNVGDKISFDAIEKQGKENVFWVLQELHRYEENVEETLPPMEDGPAPAKAQENDPVIDAVFGEKEPIGTLQETRKGIVGEKRQVRLWTLMSQNAKKTGLTREIVHQILNQMEPPVAHLKDLTMDLYPMWERLMTGDEPWKPLLEN